MQRKSDITHRERKREGIGVRGREREGGLTGEREGGAFLKKNQKSIYFKPY